MSQKKTTIERSFDELARRMIADLRRLPLQDVVRHAQTIALEARRVVEWSFLPGRVPGIQTRVVQIGANDLLETLSPGEVERQREALIASVQAAWPHAVLTYPTHPLVTRDGAMRRHILAHEAADPVYPNVRGRALRRRP